MRKPIVETSCANSTGRLLRGRLVDIYSVITFLAILMSTLFSMALQAEPLKLSSEEVKQRAREIDNLVDAKLKEKNLKPLPQANDTTFIRRIYLDLGGRIPYLEELQQYLDDPENRSGVIDELLTSQAYESQSFNWWADILRLKSRDRNIRGPYFVDWVKASISQNKPYDQWVYEMLTATGRPRDNGATGYMIQDKGMLKDNAAITAQLFLGAQISCAQCHDHPYEDWTQKQFYEFASFTATANTKVPPTMSKVDETTTKYDIRMHQKKNRMKGKAFKNRINELPQKERRNVQNMIQFLSIGMTNNDETLKLPKDYKYDNAKPNEAVNTGVVFAQDLMQEIKASTDGNNREIFARWMTSPKNDRFSKVIANRIWKQLIGHGLFEPLDDYSEEAFVTNRPLLDHLSNLMVELDFDLRAFRRVICHTDVYQRQPSQTPLTYEIAFGQAADLRRLKAEELWDSLLTLGIKDIDEKTIRKKNGYGTYAQYAALDISDLSVDEVLALPEKLKANKNNGTMMNAGMMQMAAEQKRKTLAPLAAEFKAKRQAIEAKYKKMRQDKSASYKVLVSKMKKEIKVLSDQYRNRIKKEQALLKNTQLARASNLPSPMPEGHFLAQFGQSRREIADAAHHDPSVPQVLAMLNGQQSDFLSSSIALLKNSYINASDDEAKLDTIWLSILSRYPTARERKLATEVLSQGEEGYRDLIWALINGREFIFVR